MDYSGRYSSRRWSGVLLAAVGPLHGTGVAVMFQTVFDDRPRLHLLATHTGEVYDLVGPSVLAGRHSDADLRLPLCDVSRRHCRFEFDHGDWHVIDLSSRNGTFVNERRVDDAVVHHGDRVRIGNFVFEVTQAESRRDELRRAA